MAGAKILCVCQEIYPYLPESPIATTCRTLSQAMQERGFEIRTFMPRFGCINERRNQLHEVIRLSGMNLIINDNDHQLIIKVASIPAARVQIYFIDNDEYFAPRKATVRNAEGEEFADNDLRAVFFARGVLETVKKLRWKPDVVHCHSWFSAAVPLYLRNCYTDEPLFSSAKIVFSIYDDMFNGTWGEAFRETMIGEGVPTANLGGEGDLTYEKLIKLVIDNADGIVVEAEQLPAEIENYLASQGKKVLRPSGDIASEERLAQYKEFYESIL
ncbi:MAG: glycogen/starch synthase [Tidjanibacter sp.]|nr:glycogen/starch synthase [Tidjanibacter sp.]